MGKGPFKMKGSPMQRNFGIGSPLAQTTDDEEKSFYEENVDAASEYRDMQADVKKEGNPLEKLSALYGGEWSKKKGMGGVMQFFNEEGQTVTEAANEKLQNTPAVVDAQQS